MGFISEKSDEKVSVTLLFEQSKQIYKPNIKIIIRRKILQISPYFKYIITKKIYLDAQNKSPYKDLMQTLLLFFTLL